MDNSKILFRWAAAASSIIVVVLASYAAADPLDNTGQYYYYSPEEIADLSDEVKNKSLPVAYKVSTKEQAKFIPEIAKLYLAELRYPDPFTETTTATKLFQSDLGDKVDGNLSIGQFFILSKRSAFVRQAQAEVVPLGISLTSSKDEYAEGWASVEGTLAILDEEIAYPINKIEIDCYRSEGICEWSQIEVQDFSDFESFLNKFSSEIYISDYEQTFKIIDWTDDQIIARPSKGNAAICRSEILTLNFPAEEFTLTSSNKNLDKELCKDIEMGSPRMSQIVSGFEIVSERRKQIRKEANALVYSGYMKAINDWAKRVEELFE